MLYRLYERVLNLRSELQTADHVIGFIELDEVFSEANFSIIRVLSQSIYSMIQDVLDHEYRTATGISLRAKYSLIGYD